MVDFRSLPLRKSDDDDKFFKLPHYPNFVYSDEVKELLEERKIKWALEEIFRAQIENPLVRKLSLQTWVIGTDENGTKVICADTASRKVVYENLVDKPYTSKTTKLIFNKGTLVTPEEF